VEFRWNDFDDFDNFDVMTSMTALTSIRLAESGCILTADHSGQKWPATPPDSHAGEFLGVIRPESPRFYSGGRPGNVAGGPKR
jgi:hypothetical protein